MLKENVKIVKRWKPELVKMNDIKFDKNLFKPMKTGKKVDSLLSSEGGLMKGTNFAFVGDPGVGKSTVMLDILSDLQKKKQKVLFISGEMTSIDMFGYVKRFPKFGKLPILFMGDYIEKDPMVVLTSVLSEGFDVVLIDSMAEVCTNIVDYHGGTMKNAETKVLNLLEKHNKAENLNKTNTTFLIIQQVTKGGEFAGSNRFKHMLTGMGHMKFTEGSRVLFFSKNRRGGQMDKLHFSLDQKNHVGWLFTEAMNGE
jgi:DNA repair protein RadA/Sms|tara:strand:+ start:15127 stop:15891 length:765 start_codon:yes stop_codon:yes gene_type:complete